MGADARWARCITLAGLILVSTWISARPPGAVAAPPPPGGPALVVGLRPPSGATTAPVEERVAAALADLSPDWQPAFRIPERRAAAAAWHDPKAGGAGRAGRPA
ncbi:MAG: hypothetical protein PVF43_01205, partial [Candidatus Eiseniibacteriota bacterium]